MGSILDGILSPADLRRLPVERVQEVADALRRFHATDAAGKVELIGRFEA